jgi:lysophospholipase L1-like esterase
MVTTAPLAAAGAGGPAGRVVVLGDSVTAGARADVDAALRPLLPGLVVDAEPCRGLVHSCRTATQDVAPTSGLEVVAANADHLGPRLVVALGYNDAPAPADLDAFLAAVTAAGVGRVSWVELSTRRGGAGGTYARVDADLRAARARWPQLEVLAWDAASSGPDADAWFVDGVHLTAAGSAAYAAFLRTALAGAPGTGADRCRVAGAGTPAMPPAPAPVVNVVPADGVHVVTPARRLDTREALPLAAGSTTAVGVAGWGPVPGDADGVVVNVTVVGACAPGYLTVHPCGTASPPLASNLNYGTGQTVANLAVVALAAVADPSPDWRPASPPLPQPRSFCLTTQSPTDVVVDVVAWIGAGGAGVVPAPPRRLLDTRAGAAVAAGAAVRVPVPAGAGAIATVTAVGADGPGYVTVWPAPTGAPCDPARRPLASALNPTGPAAVANLAVVDATGGALCLFTSVRTHLLVDLAAGLTADGARWGTSTPIRLVDTRVDGTHLGAGEARPIAVVGGLVVAPASAGGVIAPASAGRAADTVVLPNVPVPTDVAAVGVNLTVVGPAGDGHLTAWPAAPDGSCAATSRPVASVSNYAAGATVPGYALVAVGGAGRICVYSWAATDLVVDLTAAVR